MSSANLLTNLLVTCVQFSLNTNVKVKAILTRAWGVTEGCKSLEALRISRQSVHGDSKVVSHNHPPSPTPKEIFPVDCS